MAYTSTFQTLPADRPGLSRLIAFALGAATTLAFEPFGLSLLAPLTVIPLLYVCVTLAPRDAAGHAFWYGFGLFLSGTYWIYISVVIIGEAPAWIALFLMFGLTLIMSLWLFIAGWLTTRFSDGEPLRLLAVAPAAWVTIEWLRGWAFTGFPWLAFGYAHTDSLLSGFAPVGGVYAVSFAAVLSAAAVVSALMTRRRVRLFSTVLVVLPWLVGGILTIVDWTEEEGSSLQVTVLQYGISQDRKWLREYRQPTLDFYRTATSIAQSSDLVIWPEVAVPSLTSRERDFIAAIQSDAREAGQSIAFGILEDVEERGERRVYNSVLLLDGDRVQVYRKRHLVPFGEYFPVPDRVREWMRMMSLPHSDLTPGADEQPLLTTAGGVRLATMICYEDAYAAEQLYALPAAGILVNVSNDAWFGDSIAPHQHLQIARMRAIESGRPMIRATNTGISGFIDHEGTILRQGPQFEEVAMTEVVRPRVGSTPYADSGNRPLIGLCLVLLGVFWLRSRI